MFLDKYSYFYYSIHLYIMDGGEGVGQVEEGGRQSQQQGAKRGEQQDQGRLPSVLPDRNHLLNIVDTSY